MSLLFLMLAATTQIQPTSQGGLLNAGQVKDRCASNSPSEISYCFAYVTGVYDTVHAYEAWLNLREFCVPYSVTQGELRRAFVDYLDAKPGFRSGEAASVIVVALKERFACTPTPDKPQGPAAAPER